MLISHFRDVSVTTTLLVVTLMNLIFFTGLLQVTVANDESTPKSATSDGNKHLKNGKLSTLGGINMDPLAKHDSFDKNCRFSNFSDSCSKEAKEIANITTATNSFSEVAEIIRSLIANATTLDEKVKKACLGLKNLFFCGNTNICQKCEYFFSMLSNADYVQNLSQKDLEVCNFTNIKPNCDTILWKIYHMGNNIPGECVPEDDKLKCVQKAVPNATDWETGFNKIISNIFTNSSKGCLTTLELGKCELISGCDSCYDDEKAQLQDLFEQLLVRNETKICPSIPGINETALKIDCNKVSTPKPTKTPFPETTPSLLSETTPSQKTSSTSSSKTVIIIVVVVVIVLLIIGGIVVYCCFFAGDKGKKKTGGKQGQKVTGKGGAVSSSKIGDGKSSSVRGAGVGIVSTFPL